MHYAQMFEFEVFVFLFHTHFAWNLVVFNCESFRGGKISNSRRRRLRIEHCNKIRVNHTQQQSRKKEEWMEKKAFKSLDEIWKWVNTWKGMLEEEKNAKEYLFVCRFFPLCSSIIYRFWMSFSISKSGAYPSIKKREKKRPQTLARFEMKRNKWNWIGKIYFYSSFLSLHSVDVRRQFNLRAFFFGSQNRKENWNFFDT